MAETIPTEIIVNKQKMTIDAAPRLTVLVHQQGIRVDVPAFIEINSRNTIECMEKMSQRAWAHISTGDLFKHLFSMAFKGQEALIPETIEDLNGGDLGIVHVSGMIVLACEAIFDNPSAKLFFRTPEDHLHPKTQRTILSMIQAVRTLAGHNGTATVETAKGEDCERDEDRGDGGHPDPEGSGTGREAEDGEGDRPTGDPA